jgi:hypothetical protein
MKKILFTYLSLLVGCQFVFSQTTLQHEKRLTLFKPYVEEIQELKLLNSNDSLPPKSQIKNSEHKLNLESMPNFALTSNLSVVPSLNIIVSRSTSNKNDSGGGSTVDFSLFGADTKSDTNITNFGRRLFIPEASTLGIRLGYNKAFVSKKHCFLLPTKNAFGVNVNIFYLSKLLVDSSKKSESNEVSRNPVGIFHFKVGVEYVFDRTVSIFGNLNYTHVVDGVDYFNQTYNVEKYKTFSCDFGARCLFDNGLFIEADFIYLNTGMKSLIKTNDEIIPLLRVGVNHHF